MMESTDELDRIFSVVFQAKSPRSLPKLLPIFLDQGFTLYEEVVSLDRIGKIPPWQHSSIVEVECRLDGDEVFGFEEGCWTEVELQYLFSALPFNLASSYLSVVHQISEALKLEPQIDGKEATIDMLKNRMDKIHSCLVSKSGMEPGSEELAILIQSTLHRL